MNNWLQSEPSSRHKESKGGVAANIVVALLTLVVFGLVFEIAVYESGTESALKDIQPVTRSVDFLSDVINVGLGGVPNTPAPLLPEKTVPKPYVIVSQPNQTATNQTSQSQNMSPNKVSYNYQTVAPTDPNYQAKLQAAKERLEVRNDQSSDATENSEQTSNTSNNTEPAEAEPVVENDKNADSNKESEDQQTETYDRLDVDCDVPQTATTDVVLTWDADADGGKRPYAYTWEVPSSNFSAEEDKITAKFDTEIKIENVTVTVTDQRGQSDKTTCSDVLVVQTVPEPKPEPEVESPTASNQTITIDPRDRIVAWFGIGGATRNNATRSLGWSVSSLGYQHFVDNSVKKAIAAGAKRVQIHNPFGTVSGEPMQLDQYVKARDGEPGVHEPLPMLVEGFVEAWKPITDQGIEVIGYVGSARLDKDVRDLAETDIDAAWAYIWENINPLVDAGMSVGLDAAAPSLPGSLDDQLAQKLRAKGVKVYVEARPKKETLQWFNTPYVITEEYFRRSDPDRFGPSDGSRDNAQNHVLDAEVIRLVRYENETTYSGLKTVLEEGHTGTIYPPRIYSAPHSPYGDLDGHIKVMNIPSLPTYIHLNGTRGEGTAALQYRITTQPQNGLITELEPQFGSKPETDLDPRQFTYTANSGYSGTDSFQFVVNDGVSDSNPATVTLKIAEYPRSSSFSSLDNQSRSLAAAEFGRRKVFLSTTTLFACMSILSLLLVIRFKRKSVESK